MKAYKIISARDAREEGFYEGGEFILEQEEQTYEPGIWLLADDGGYAKWYGSMDALIEMTEGEFH